ncbi:uncharacterized protein V1516DRAFT_712438 [Lipomyces oligophaga]|uniref:uncharacterized protein n=1 Tax=Lipomyces oligophaga TaxID=45792 RepID=UPI0034CD075B
MENGEIQAEIVRLELEQIQWRASSLRQDVEDVCNCLEMLLSRQLADQGYKPAWTRGSTFLRRYLAVVEKEHNLLQKLELVIDTRESISRISHQLRSTNLPHLESVWQVFTSRTHTGVISLGSSAKSNAAIGDLMALYGRLAIKVSRVTVQQLNKEMVRIAAELGEDNLEECFEECCMNTDVYNVARKLARWVASRLEDDEDMLANGNDGGVRILCAKIREQATGTIVFTGCCESYLAGPDQAFLNRFLEFIQRSLSIDTLVLSKKERLSNSEIASGILSEDRKCFESQIPELFCFDVTGLLSLVSDVTNLAPDEALARLARQKEKRQQGTEYRKSENAFAFLEKQIESERSGQRVLKGVLEPLLRDGNRQIVCGARTLESVKKMVLRMGSQDERRRTAEIFQTINLIPDIDLGTKKDQLQLDQHLNQEPSEPFADEEWIIRHVLTPAELWARKNNMEAMFVTGNLRMAKQLCKLRKTSPSFSTGTPMLVVGSRSLVGGI